jgi:hypothetical protein
MRGGPPGGWRPSGAIRRDATRRGDREESGRTARSFASASASVLRRSCCALDLASSLARSFEASMEIFALCFCTFLRDAREVTRGATRGTGGTGASAPESRDRRGARVVGRGEGGDALELRERVLEGGPPLTLRHRARGFGRARGAAGRRARAPRSGRGAARSERRSSRMLLASAGG